MLFNSFRFLVFFLVLYSLYLATARHHKWQNRILFVAGLIFYASWDWRFLPLLLFTVYLDYFIAAKIHASESPRKRKALLIFSIVCNLGVLGFFKYFNFFAANVSLALTKLGFDVPFHVLPIVLPIGISFYTFQSMSYTIDVYRRELTPPKDIWDFGLFVTFFPHLVAGPILRATSILPQILKPRKIETSQFYEGCYLIFWGLFQKVFVADNLARIADPVFHGSGPYEGFHVLIAVYAFAFQILCDFAGYSDMARGLGKLLGFDIVVNFNLPYFATNPREFWKRWHISLSTWLRDYVYIPLGGNRGGNVMVYRNLLLTMLIGGLWHGAAWTFVIWGAYHGFLLIAHRLAEPVLQKIPEPQNPVLRAGWFSARLIFFFHLICLGWLFFRAQSAGQAMQMLSAVFAMRFQISYEVQAMAAQFAFYAGILFCCHLIQFLKKDLLAVYRSPVLIKAGFYLSCFYLLLAYGVTNARAFIYFQF